MKILVIQTAFIGDVILATALLENIHLEYPEAQLDFLVRKGNESLTAGHPFIHETLIFDKKKNKYRHLLQLVKKIRRAKYDYVINAQRFATTGIITVLSGGKHTIGFDKNPFSFGFSTSVTHHIDTTNKTTHEINRNHSLLKDLVKADPLLPKLYPSKTDFEGLPDKDTYVCLAPASVWFTKQYPKEGWMRLAQGIPEKYSIVLIGGPGDKNLCDEIIEKSGRENAQNMAGKLTFLQSAAFIKNARMTFANDSAPIHIASAMNANITAIFCSTIPEFGFGPLSNQSFIAETQETLTCRPCGLHGKSTCPLQHFNCSKIDPVTILKISGI